MKQAVVANDEVAEVPQPCVGAFDLPTFAIASEWSTVLCRLADSVCLMRHDQFDTPLGFPDAGAPFLAEAKLPSINASLQSRCPLRSNSANKARHTRSQTPRCSQSCNRRQQVAGEGYSAGRSCHLAPLRAIHRMPSRTRLLSAQGRPPRLLLRNLGSKGSIFAHCPSLSIGPPRGIGPSSCHLIAHRKSLPQALDLIPNQVMKQLLVPNASSNPSI